MGRYKRLRYISTSTEDQVDQNLAPGTEYRAKAAMPWNLRSKQNKRKDKRKLKQNVKGCANVSDNYSFKRYVWSIHYDEVLKAEALRRVLRVHLVRCDNMIKLEYNKNNYVAKSDETSRKVSDMYEPVHNEHAYSSVKAVKPQAPTNTMASKHSSSTVTISIDSFFPSSVQESTKAPISLKLQDLNSSVVQREHTVMNPSTSSANYETKNKDNESTISKHAWSDETQKLNISGYSPAFGSHEEVDLFAMISNNCQKSNRESTELVNTNLMDDYMDRIDDLPDMERKSSNIEHTAKKMLPIITKDDILPKGTIKIERTEGKVWIKVDAKQRMFHDDVPMDEHLKNSTSQPSNLNTADNTVVSRKEQHRCLPCSGNSNFSFGWYDTENNNTVLCVCSPDGTENVSQNIENDVIQNATVPDETFENVKGKSVTSSNSPDKAAWSLESVPEPCSVFELTVDNLEKFTNTGVTHAEKEEGSRIQLEEYIKLTSHVENVEIEETTTIDKPIGNGIKSLDNNSNVLRKKQKFHEINEEIFGYTSTKRIKLDNEYFSEDMANSMNNKRSPSSPNNCDSSVLPITTKSLETAVVPVKDVEINHCVEKSDTLPEDKIMEILETESSNKDKLFTVAGPEIKVIPDETFDANQGDLREIQCAPDTTRSEVYKNDSNENYQPSEKLDRRILEKKPKQNDEDDDGDSISLAASMNFSDYGDFDDPVPKKSRNTSDSDKCYIMHDDTLKTYINNTKSEFNQMYDSSMRKEEQRRSIKKSIPIAVQSSSRTRIMANSSTTKSSALFNNVTSLRTASSLAKKTTKQIISDKKTVVSNVVKEKLANDSKNTRIPITYSTKVVTTKSTSALNKVAIAVPDSTRTNKISAGDNRMNFLYGICFDTLRANACRSRGGYCSFDHDLTTLIARICSEQKQHVVDVIQHLVSKEFKYFTRLLCPKFVLEVNSTTVLLTVFKLLCDAKYLNDAIISDIVKQLIKLNVPLKLIVTELISLVNNNNCLYLDYISKEIEKHIRTGQYWDTLRSLVLKRMPNLRIAKLIVLECISREKGSATDLRKLRLKAEDVNKNLICRLTDEQRCQINPQLLRKFENLLKLKCSSPTKPSIIASPDREFTNNFIQKQQSSKDKLLSTSVEEQPSKNIIHKANEIRGDEDSEKGPSFGLRAIDGLKQPSSAHGKAKFWKFYLIVKSLKEGLKHKDYEHVISILKTAKEDQTSLFSRTCYNILCKEVKLAQHHMSQIIALTVRNGMTVLRDKILIDVAIHILARLADEEFWVLAYKLLKDINVILQMEMVSCRFDAAVIILLAQIYLANQRPVKALNLFRQSKLIYTHRSNWAVRNTADDDEPRAKTLALLLYSLCEVSPEHAFFLFEFLVTDQTSNAYPVDLTRLANKVVSVVLTEGDSNSIISIGRLIGKYDLTLNTITYRALTSMLVHSDLDLAKQLYQAAIGLNIYSEPKFESTATYVIIKCDSSEEEVYLIILDLIHRILLNVGHCLGRLKPLVFKIYLVQEVLPPDRLLYSDEGSNDYYTECMKRSKTLVCNILSKRFEPPIRLVSTNRGRLCKISSKSLVNYLQARHCD